jgi:geranylgeranyl pyrophosphate synthase
VTDVFLDILSRGGKRIRGALLIAGYDMAGGTNKAMIMQAATAIEMLHAYMLIVDDIQDRSSLRRGKPAAHRMLTSMHADHGFHGDSDHTGVSLAINAALTGAHMAENILADLDVSAELRLKAIKLVNHTMLVTVNGQTVDITNEVHPAVQIEQIEQVLEWKTANYTVLGPLQTGMLLAGADDAALEAIKSYALAAGKTFQISDDVLGVFGEESKSGKNSMDDVREGKQTLLTFYALQHASPEEAAFLRSMLGNAELTTEDFARCKTIIEQTGSLAHAEERADDYIKQAIEALQKDGHRWKDTDKAFLEGLVQAFGRRTA